MDEKPKTAVCGSGGASRMNAAVFRERAPAGVAEGLLVLHHGRGADEQDLLPLADALDPRRRLHVATPRGPLQLPGWPGRHWYMVPRVGYPDAQTFHASYALLADLHDELWRRTGVGPERTVLGGFSMGAVMSYALALGGDRPPPAGVLALSGFIPTLAGWQPSFADRRELAAFVAHGSEDRVIDVEFARAARAALSEAGLPVEYHEFAGGHQLDPMLLPAVRAWLQARLPVGSPPRG